VDRFLERAGIEIIPFDAARLAHAREAFARCGKGRNPPAPASATAAPAPLPAAEGAPPPHKGRGFAATDLPPA
jgi:uncharacterized protein with PIN domain